MMKMMMSHDERFAPYLNQVRLKLNNGAVQTLSTAGRAIPLTIDLHYKLLHNRTNIPFIISDHPVGKYNQFMERRNIDMGCTGFASRGLQNHLLPISLGALTLIDVRLRCLRVGSSAGNNVCRSELC